MTNPRIAIVLVISAVLALALLLHDRTDIQNRTATAPQILEQKEPGVAVAPERGKPAVQSAEKLDRLSEKRLAVKDLLHHRDELWGDFERAPDLLPFVQQLMPAAAGNDAESQYLIASALHYCQNIESTLPKEGSDDLRTSTSLTERQRDLAKRCDQLTDAQKRSHWSADQWMQKAAANGSGRALFDFATETDSSRPVSERVADFHRALETSDPDLVPLILQEAKSLGVQSASFGQDPQTENALISLLRCQLGSDCSNAGIYHQFLCATEDCRHADSVERAIELSINPQQYQSLQDRTQQLAQELLSGAPNWPEVSAIEEDIRASQQRDSMK